MKKLTDLTGQKSGKLTIISYSHRVGRQNYWICECECGTTKPINHRHLMDESTKSCGCLNGEFHGLSTDKIYKAYRSMLSRCNNHKDKDYANYGGRGIKVCDRWSSPTLFIQDMGMPPTKTHTLDRIDVNGNYEPSNCRWATRLEQENNKRRNVYYDYKCERFTLSQLSRLISIPRSTLENRLKRGWDQNRVFNT